MKKENGYEADQNSFALRTERTQDLQSLCPASHRTYVDTGIEREWTYRSKDEYIREKKSNYMYIGIYELHFERCNGTEAWIRHMQMKMLVFALLINL